VEEPSSKDHVWWGKVNVPLCEKSFLTNRERAVDYLNAQKKLYIVDGYAGYGARWGKKYQLPIRIITTRAYHALFMQNMLVMPSKEELAKDFGPNAPRKPFVVYNAGCFPCNRQTDGMTSSTSVSVHFAREEMVILGTQYAGEMKKGVFTLMNYYMPLTPSPDLPPGKRNCPLHASANIGKDNDVSIFFGLSGTGKTTLSADPKRELIGDDEHVWTDEGVFNIEGGCYAKTVGLSREKEPEVYDAIRFGSVLENVVYDDTSRVVDFDDTSITENGRVSYDLSFIPNARIPAIVDYQPKNIILLTCDAFGVLPPVSRLTPAQVMYHFISGYTAKVAGTEMGVTEPQATFSPCFGGPFLVHHPFVYAEILAARIDQTPDTCAYLVNTGWVGGGYGVGSRCSLKYTRALIDAIHDGTLADLSDSDYETMPVFGLQVPKKPVNGVPLDVLHPSKAWAASGKSQADFDAGAKHLAQLFSDNFKEYSAKCSADVIDAGPKA
jgi:phosphoenolpyruvate carboxykinase (ATP)